MKLEYTRKIIDAIHDGSLLKANFSETPVFGLQIPDQVNGVPSNILHPENMVYIRVKFSFKSSYEYSCYCIIVFLSKHLCVYVCVLQTNLLFSYGVLRFI